MVNRTMLAAAPPAVAERVARGLDDHEGQGDGDDLGKVGERDAAPGVKKIATSGVRGRYSLPAQPRCARQHVRAAPAESRAAR